jgi:hypothetical protein
MERRTAARVLRLVKSRGDHQQRQHIYGAAGSHAEKAGNTSRTSKVVVRIASSKVIVPKAMSQTK